MNKLRKTPLTIANAHAHFNMRLITMVYFGCGLLILSEKQEEELMKISEGVLLRKLELSKRFPRRTLRAKRTQLGTGMLKPTTIIAVLALKLCAGHLRNEDEVSKLIILNEKNVQFQHRCRKEITETNCKLKPKQKVQSDEIALRVLE